MKELPIDWERKVIFDWTSNWFVDSRKYFKVVVEFHHICNPLKFRIVNTETVEEAELIMQEFIKRFIPCTYRIITNNGGHFDDRKGVIYEISRKYNA